MRPADLERAIKRDLAKLEKNIHRAMQRTADRAVPIVRKNAPKAFGSLGESVHSEPHKTVVDAPHANAVEIGARPHVVPLSNLVAWVKLRGMQGLSKTGRVRKTGYGKLGPTTKQHAMSIASQLKRMESGGSLDVDSPMRIAIAIQDKIAKHGMKPHWFVSKSLPAIMQILDANLKRIKW